MTFLCNTIIVMNDFGTFFLILISITIFYVYLENKAVDVTYINKGGIEFLVRNLDDKEQAAKACYMAAKCELIDFYHSEAYKEPECCNTVPYIPEEFGSYYNLLLDQYGDTKFYEKIINECQFFRAYAYR